jgi:chromosome segregation ATPase
VRQDRDDCSKQYDQWRTTQRSRHFTSIGKTAREELDRHAAQLKWRRDSQDKLLSSLIDRLATHTENPHALEMESVRKEATRYTSEAQQWIESLRLRSPPHPVPPTSHQGAIPDASSSRVPQPLDAEGDVEMESGEIFTDDFSYPPESIANASVMRLWTRIMTVEGKLNEIELNPTGDVSPDVAAIVERALTSRNSVEDGELSNVNDKPEKILALDQTRAELQRVQDRLSEATKDKQALSAAPQALDTQITALGARFDELETRETEVSLAEAIFIHPIFFFLKTRF